MVQGLAGFSQVSHNFLTAESSGFPAAGPGGRTQDPGSGCEKFVRGFIGRTLTAGPGLKEICEKLVREGIHRPDPNPGCIMLLHTGFSQLSDSRVLGVSSSQAWRPDPRRGPDQDCERGLVQAFVISVFVGWTKQSCSAQAQSGRI